MLFVLDHNHQTPMAINSCMPATDSLSIPLGIRTGKAGMYQLAPGENTSDYPLYIHDQKRGIVQKLNTSSGYRFSSSEGTHNHRFRLISTNRPLPEQSQTSQHMYASGQTVYIILPQKPESGWVRIYNIHGQQLIHKQLHSRRQSIRLPGTHGIVVAEVHSGSETFTRKLLLR